jgi:hypothetical protein
MGSVVRPQSGFAPEAFTTFAGNSMDHSQAEYKRKARELLRLARICFRQAAHASDPKVAVALKHLGNTHLAEAKAIDPTINPDEVTWR